MTSKTKKEPECTAIQSSSKEVVKLQKPLLEYHKVGVNYKLIFEIKNGVIALLINYMVFIENIEVTMSGITVALCFPVVLAGLLNEIDRLFKEWVEGKENKEIRDKQKERST